MRLKQNNIGIGQNLKRLRKDAGFSQATFAKEMQLLGINISCDIYKKMENNKYNIHVYELVAMTHILNVSFDELFEGITLDDITESNED